MSQVLRPHSESRFVTAELVLGSRATGDDRVQVVELPEGVLIVVADGRTATQRNVTRRDRWTAQVREPASSRRNAGTPAPQRDSGTSRIARSAPIRQTSRRRRTRRLPSQGTCDSMNRGAGATREAQRS